MGISERGSRSFVEQLQQEWRNDVKKQLDDLKREANKLREDCVSETDFRERYEALRYRVESLEKFNARVLGILGFLQFAGMGVVWFVEWYFGKR